MPRPMSEDVGVYDNVFAVIHKDDADKFTLFYFVTGPRLGHGEWSWWGNGASGEAELTGGKS